MARRSSRVRVDGVEELISGQEWDDLNARGEAPERIATVVPDTELLTVTGAEAIEYGFADALAETVDDVLAKEGLAGATWEELEFSAPRSGSRSSGTRACCSSSWGFFGYVEMEVPGFGVRILSLAAFTVMFAGQYLVGVADGSHRPRRPRRDPRRRRAVPRSGDDLAGAVGAVCLISRLLLTQVGQDISLTSAWDRTILFDASFELAATATAALVGIWAISRYLPDTPSCDGWCWRAAADGRRRDARGALRRAARAARTGARGRAITSLRPVGKVDLDGDGAGTDYEARAGPPRSRPEPRSRYRGERRAPARAPYPPQATPRRPRPRAEARRATRSRSSSSSRHGPRGGRGVHPQHGRARHGRGCPR